MRILGYEDPLNRLLKTVYIVVLLMVMCSSSLDASVAETTLCELTAIAEFIVIAKTVEIVEVDGVELAHATIQQNIKGSVGEEIYYLAGGTWTCDISGAEKGEEALLFLNRYEYQSPKPRRPSDDAPNIGVFNEPVHFKSKVRRATGSSRLLRIAWAGRGQMPFHLVGSETYVTIWTDDVRLPTAVETIDGPEAEYADFIRSAALDHIVFLVGRYLETCGNAK